MPAYDPERAKADGTLTAEQAAERLGVSMRTVRELLRTNILTGTQAIKFAPWRIPVDALKDSAVVERIKGIRDGKHPRVRPTRDDHALRLPGM